MEITNLKIYEGISLVLVFSLINVILSSPSLLISNTASATILNLIVISIFLTTLFLLYSKLFSMFPGCNLLNISEYLGGKFVKNILCTLYIFFILLVSAITIRLFAEEISLIYFSHLQIDLIVLAFIIISSFINKLGIKTIIRISIFIAPLTILSIIFLFFSSLGNYTYERIYPLLGYGFFETFVAGIKNVFSFCGLYILLFIFPFFSNEKSFKKAGIYSIALYSIFLILGTSALLFSVPQVENLNTPMSLYFLARQISFGDYIQSIDALFLIIWIPSVLAYISINNNLALKTFKEMTNIKYESGVTWAFASILFLACSILDNYSELNLLSNSLLQYLSIIFVFGISFTILVLASLKKKIMSFLKN